jgi:hypothetical protein
MCEVWVCDSGICDVVVILVCYVCELWQIWAAVVELLVQNWGYAGIFRPCLLLQVIRVLPKPEPEFAGSKFSTQNSGISFGNPNYFLPELPNPNLRVNPNTQRELEGPDSSWFDMFPTI